jgi:hypothetical protein
MRKYLFFIAGLSTLCLFTACSPGYVSQEPTYVEVQRPLRPGVTHVWRDGDWVYSRRNRTYVRQNGFWVTPTRGRTYEPGHWHVNSRGHRWVSGRWR